MWGLAQREALSLPQVGKAGVWVEGGDAQGEVGTGTTGEFLLGLGPASAWSSSQEK